MFILLVSIIITQLVALATPGPDFFFVSQVAASNSRKNSLYAVLGITAGVLIWALAAVLGLNIILKQFPWIHKGIMVMGGAYLSYLAYLLSKSALQAHKVKLGKIDTTHIIKSEKNFFVRGLFTNLSNAKALVYFVSIFSAIVSDSTPLTTKEIILTIITLETFIWFTFIAYVFSLPKIKAKYQSYTKYVDGIASLCFGFFGLYLILTALLTGNL